MGKNKETSNSQSTQTQTTTPQATPEETRLNQLAIQREEALNPDLIATQKAGMSLVQQLLQGSESLPGFYGDVGRGISPDVTNSIVDQSIKDISPYFAQSGLIDSGVRASISARTAGDIRNQAAQFNIGNKLSLLNLALSGQAQVQQPILGYSSLLSSRLAGLRPVTTAGSVSSSGASYGMNPFLKSFQESFGSSLGRTFGAPKVSVGPVSFGG